MVRKLYKHEIMAYLRTLIPMYIVILAVAVWGRIVQFFESDNVIYNIICNSTVTAYVVTIIVSIVLTVIFSITRFYRNLFTGEGYLSFTLPVTSGQHVRTKLFTATLFDIITIAIIFISACIMTAGDLFDEIIKAIAYIAKRGNIIFKGHLPIYVIEFIICVIASVMAGMLLYYTCIAIGQTARKNRVLAAIGVYFAYYFITQIISTIFVVCLSLLDVYVEKIMIWIGNHMIPSIHIALIGVAVINVLLGLLYYMVTNHIIKKRLNLE